MMQTTMELHRNICRILFNVLRSIQMLMGCSVSSTGILERTFTNHSFMWEHACFNTLASLDAIVQVVWFQAERTLLTRVAFTLALEGICQSFREVKTLL